MKTYLLEELSMVSTLNEINVPFTKGRNSCSPQHTEVGRK